MRPISRTSNAAAPVAALIVKHRSSGPSGNGSVEQSGKTTTPPLTAYPENLASRLYESTSPTSSSVCARAEPASDIKQNSPIKTICFLFIDFSSFSWVARAGHIFGQFLFCCWRPVRLELTAGIDVTLD